MVLISVLARSPNQNVFKNEEIFKMFNVELEKIDKKINEIRNFNIEFMVIPYGFFYMTEKVQGIKQSQSELESCIAKIKDFQNTNQLFLDKCVQDIDAIITVTKSHLRNYKRLVLDCFGDHKVLEKMDELHKTTGELKSIDELKSNCKSTSPGFKCIEYKLQSLLENAEIQLISKKFDVLKIRQIVQNCLPSQGSQKRMKQLSENLSNNFEACKIRLMEAERALRAYNYKSHVEPKVPHNQFMLEFKRLELIVEDTFQRYLEAKCAFSIFKSEINAESVEFKAKL